MQRHTPRVQLFILLPGNQNIYRMKHGMCSSKSKEGSLSAGGLPIVWVTHDLGQMQRLAHHVLVVVGGRIVFSGVPTAAAAFLAADGSHAR